ncbi:uncharacterized protein FOMMEDRAFT_56488, partial [Fomitiporia mediterranea MF3/22]|uniref:uncharacterized protein n=1 Tax=Fomitiporia mediterranea (strain MF3/22) TaxID=694068 RepID=UPI0004408197
SDFNDAPILDYLRLDEDCRPLPSEDPIAFLQQHQHLKRLPPNLLSSFSSITSPKQRTIITAIRNRRLNFANSSPHELEFDRARDTWPQLWQGNGQDRPNWRVEERENRDEKVWADSQFLGGERQHVGKLGTLLGNYEEERAAERMRTSRRRVVEEFVPEEDSDESDNDNDVTNSTWPDNSSEENKVNFERLIRERFIYGLLDSIDYDAVDWNDRWDPDNDRLDEERWFDEE